MRQFCGRYLPCKESHGIICGNEEVKMRNRRLPKNSDMYCGAQQTIETQEEHLCQS